MKKRLFVCETPYQIIIAMLLRNQISKNKDFNCILITNTFNGYHEIANRIKKLNIFDLVCTADIIVDNKIKKLNYVFRMKAFLEKIHNDKIEIYDELYFWNYDSFVASLRPFFFRKNKNLKAYFFEEGYISYFPYNELVQSNGSILMKIVNLKNRCLHNLSFDNVNGIFVFEPNLLLYTPPFNVYQITRDSLNNKKFKEQIKYIFNVDESVKKYDKKYIILEEFHEEYNDKEIFNNIINVVGKDNVIIKLHPRRTKNRFEKTGVKTLGNDGIPWEALLIAEDFSDKVIISIGSGSITTQRVLFGNDNMNAYLLFKCVNANIEVFSEKYAKFWKSLKSTIPNKGIHIPTSLKEFYKMLEKNDN